MSGEPTFSPHFVVSRKRILLERFARRWLLLLPLFAIVLIMGIILGRLAMPTPEPAVAVISQPVTFRSNIRYNDEPPVIAEATDEPTLMPTAIWYNTAPDIGSPTQIAPAQALSADTCAAQSRTAANINLRSGPGLNFDVVGSVNAGQKVEIVSQTADGWYRVIIGKDSAGWLAGSVINRTGKCDSVPTQMALACTITNAIGQPVNIRLGAGTDKSVIATLSPTAVLMADVKTSDGWYRLLLGTQFGWVYQDVVSASGGCASLPQKATEKPQSEEVVALSTGESACQVRSFTGDAVNLRQGPGMGFAVSGQLTDSQVSALRSDNGWYQVGAMGWAFAPDLRFEGPCSALPMVKAKD